MKNYNRYFLKTTTFAFIIALSSACERHNRNQDFDVAHQLFEKNIRITESYIDSITNAPDSTSLQSLLANFDIHIASLNYQFPANTDLLFSEEENDSLIRMHKRLVKIKNQRLISLSKTNTDSISPADSVMKNKKQTETRPVMLQTDSKSKTDTISD